MPCAAYVHSQRAADIDAYSTTHRSADPRTHCRYAQRASAFLFGTLMCGVRRSSLRAVPTLSPTFAPETPSLALPASVSIPLAEASSALVVPANESERVLNVSFDAALASSISPQRDSAVLTLTSDGEAQLNESYTLAELIALEATLNLSAALAKRQGSDGAAAAAAAAAHWALQAGRDIGTLLLAPTMRLLLRWDISNALDVPVTQVVVNSLAVAGSGGGGNGSGSVLCSFVVRCADTGTCQTLSSGLANQTALSQGSLTGLNGTSSVAVAPIVTVGRCADGQFLASCAPTPPPAAGSATSTIVAIAVAVGAVVIIGVAVVCYRARRPRSADEIVPSPQARFTREQRREAAAGATARSMRTSLGGGMGQRAYAVDPVDVGIQLPAMDADEKSQRSAPPTVGSIYRVQPPPAPAAALPRSPTSPTAAANAAPIAVPRAIGDVRAMYSAAGSIQATSQTRSERSKDGSSTASQ